MDSCLSEDMGALIFDPAVVESRRKSELQHFKQLSCSRHAHQGNHKRSRPVSASIYDLSEIKLQEPPLLRAHSGLDGSVTSHHFLADLKGKEVYISSGDGRMKSSGLIRSQSYPPEGWHNTTRKRILKISNTAQSSTAAECFSTLSNEHLRFMKDIFSATWTNRVASSFPQCVAPIMVEVLQRQQDEKSLKTDTLSASSSTMTDVREPTYEASSTGAISMEEVAESPPPSSERLVDSLQSATLPVALSMVDSSCGASERPVDSLQRATLPVALSMVDSSCGAASNVVIEEGPLTSVEVYAQLSRCTAARQCPHSNKVLACGRRREMEDTAVIVPSFAVLPCGAMGMCRCDSEFGKKTASDLHFFGVYDGHGGSQASTYCMERLHLLLAEELKTPAIVESCDDNLGHGMTSKWEHLMTDCFSKTDKDVGGVCPNGICDDDAIDSTCTFCEDAIAPENVGTTAVVAVVGSCQIVVANCGDSRAVLSRGGKAIALSRDHKPERDDETSRIEAAGGRVICWDGYRVGGFLALSRAIGDRYLKRYVISEPEVTCVQREGEDECLILASDGLWDVISNDYACEVARKGLVAARRKRENRTFSLGEDPASSSVAALLVKLAYSRGSKDNISVVLVDLKS